MTNPKTDVRRAFATLIAAALAVACVPAAAAAIAQSTSPQQAARDIAAAVDAYRGLWMGHATGGERIAVILAAKPEDMGLGGQLAVPAFGTLGVPARYFLADGRLRTSVKLATGDATIDVVRKGDALEGTLRATPPGAPGPIDLPLRLERTIEARRAKDATAWAGELLVPGSGGLMMGLTVAPNGSGGWAGAIEIPAQKIAGLPLFVSRAEDGTFTCRLPVQVEATIVGRPDEAGRFKGEFRQGGFAGLVDFAPHPAGRPIPNVKSAPKPQDPVDPVPYRKQDVRIAHPAGHELAGTLFLPPGASATARVPGVVLLTGSGPQDRDEALMGHRPFLVLADALARKGIAVLRCDDRGVAGSSGDYAAATTRDFATDAEAELAWLAAVPEVDASRVGFVGHSEGGLVAPIASVELDAKADGPRSAFLVLLAGTAVPGAAILKEQNTRILLAARATPEVIAPIKAAHAALVDAAVAGKPDAELQELAKALVTEQLEAQKIDLATLPAGTLDAQAATAVKQMTSPWMRQFLVLDPRDWLRKVRVPVLALNGALDVQVTAEQNVPAMQAALKDAGVPATVQVEPDLNHLFQPAKTGGADEYAVIATTIDPRVLATVADWVNAQPPRGPRAR
jgi:hypothetical protein